MRRWVVAIAVAIAVVGTSSTAVVIERRQHTRTHEIAPPLMLTARQEALIGRARPAAGCNRPVSARPTDRYLTALTVIRLVGTCLTTTTEFVPQGQLSMRRDALRREPSVVVAAVAPPVFVDQPDERRAGQWNLDMIGARGQAVPQWPDGQGVVVAVLDTGIDASHPDLTGAVTGRHDFGQVGTNCDAGTRGHGTEVAGVIAARANNGGIVGVASRVSLLDVPIELSGCNHGAGDWWQGLIWAVNSGARVVNMSFGGDVASYDPNASAAARSATLYAERNDVVLVAAAGNCGVNLRENNCTRKNMFQYPAALPGVIGVGAVDRRGAVMLNSTENNAVTIVAPGQRVPTATPGGGYTEEFNLTSAAAPHVAAAAATAREARPDLAATTIHDTLVKTARHVTREDGARPTAGDRLIDVPAFMDAIRGTAPNTAPTTSPPAASLSEIAGANGSTAVAVPGGVEAAIWDRLGNINFWKIPDGGSWTQLGKSRYPVVQEPSAGVKVSGALLRDMTDATFIVSGSYSGDSSGNDIAFTAGSRGWGTVAPGSGRTLVATGNASTDYTTPGIYWNEGFGADSDKGYLVTVIKNPFFSMAHGGDYALVTDWKWSGDGFTPAHDNAFTAQLTTAPSPARGTPGCPQLPQDGTYGGYLEGDPGAGPHGAYNSPFAGYTVIRLNYEQSPAPPDCIFTVLANVPMSVEAMTQAGTSVWITAPAWLLVADSLTAPNADSSVSLSADYTGLGNSPYYVPPELHVTRLTSDLGVPIENSQPTNQTYGLVTVKGGRVTAMAITPAPDE